MVAKAREVIRNLQLHQVASSCMQCFTMPIPIPHRYFRGWHLMLLIDKEPFTVYFVVAVTVDTYEQYVVFLTRLF